MYKYRYVCIHICIKCYLERTCLNDRKYFHEACRIFFKEAILNTTQTNAGFEWQRFKNRSLEAQRNTHNV